MTRFDGALGFSLDPPTPRFETAGDDDDDLLGGVGGCATLTAVNAAAGAGGSADVEALLKSLHVGASNS